MISKEDIDRIVAEIGVNFSRLAAEHAEGAIDRYSEREGFSESAIDYAVDKMTVLTLMVEKDFEETGEFALPTYMEYSDLLANIGASLQMALMLGWELHKQYGATGTEIT